ncbi:hydantoin racemase [Cryobacterium sp. Y82]|uniref:hydantoin racemase n=1 Tax=Cryobacterium sp. Y82 TaxID=2045017 RepID=UPI001304D9D0|nr:hydantoin racemase [Cryobacterium sp. Y82]
MSVEEIARRQHRYDRLVPAGVRVLVENLGAGSEVPRSLETHDDIVASEQCLIARYRAVDGTGWSGFLPDCVLDPVVDSPPGLFARPVYGILKLTTTFLLGQGLTVGAVARNDTIARELDRKLALYGAAISTAILGLSVDDISDEARWARATRDLLSTATDDAVINGCSAVEVPDVGTKLVDPTSLALQLLGLSAKLHLSPRAVAWA